MTIIRILKKSLVLTYIILTHDEPVHISVLKLKRNKIAFTLFSKLFFRLINENNFSTSYILQEMSVIIIQ